GVVLGVGAAAEVAVAVGGDPLVGRVLQQGQQRIVGRGGDAEAGLDVGKGVETHGKSSATEDTENTEKRNPTFLSLCVLCSLGGKPSYTCFFCSLMTTARGKLG